MAIYVYIYPYIYYKYLRRKKREEDWVGSISMCLPAAGAQNPNYNRGLNNAGMMSLPFF